MTLELRPLGVACNIACAYCYQDPQRDAGNITPRYSLDAMKAAAERRAGPVTLFGGEPLMLPLPDLTELLRWAAERPGGVGIQTNGTLVTDAHVALFRTYQVQVGISVDGPGELNDLRRQGSPERTRAATRTTHEAIARLAREHRPPGLIVTLHRLNAGPDRLPRLLAWARDVDRLGIRSMRLHLLEVDGPAARAAALTDEENTAALTAFEDLELSGQLSGLRFDVVDETRAALRGADERNSCVWRGCDPYTTPAVQGIEGDGRSSNCGRTNKDGVDFVKADRHAFDRPLALYATPRADGGCAGCRFFLACRGQCPGTAIGGDWRNRSEQCAVWTAMFLRAEAAVAAEGHVPVSLDPRRPELEQRLIDHWRHGIDATTARLLREIDAPDEHVPTVNAPNTTPNMATGAPDTTIAMSPRISFSSGSDRGRAVLAAAREASWRAALASVAAGHEQTALVAPGGAGALTVRLAAAEQGLHARVLRGSIDDDRPGPLLVVARHADLTVQDVATPTERRCTCGRDLPSPVAGPALWSAHRQQSADEHDAGAEVVDVPAGGLNLLWRSLGIGLLDRLPCGVDCPAARDQASRRRDAARDAGVRDLDALDDVLAWPAHWSALHGIAELRAPLLRLTYPTAYTAHRVEIRFAGSAYPADGATGVRFPYRRPPSARRRATGPVVSASAPAWS